MIAVARDSSASPLRIEDLRTGPKRRRREKLVKSLLMAAALLSVVISAMIIASLTGEAWGFLREVDLGALWSSGWYPRSNEFDLRTIVSGTLIVTVIAMLVAAPTGLGAAIYLSEYARPKIRRIVKPMLEILAGIPSVVLGFFAFTWISPQLVQRVFGSASQANLLAAGIGVGILTIPLVAAVSEDAMRSVPSALREASYGLGARKVSTCINVVVPAAISGIVAALILATSRAIGETMVVVLAAGGSGGAALSIDPTQQGLTMTAAMATVARGTDQVAGSGPSFQSPFFVGLLLFAFTLGLNMIANRFVRRIQERY